jgi:hypothetical protein
MVESVKKSAEAEKFDEKVIKEATKETLLSLAKSDDQKAPAVKAPSQIQEVPKAEISTQPAKTESEPSEAKEAKQETSKTEVKEKGKKEADPGKEFVDNIMTEMSLKGASKKRLIRHLVELNGLDKQRVMFKLKRALITERYTAAHEAEAGH